MPVVRDILAKQHRGSFLWTPCTNNKYNTYSESKLLYTELHNILQYLIWHTHWPAVWSWQDLSTATWYSMARQSAACRSCSVYRTMQPESSSRHRGSPMPNRWSVNWWLPVQHRIDYKVSVLTYRTLNTSVPQYLSQRINRRVNARTPCTTTTPLLIQPFARTDFAKCSFDAPRHLSGSHFLRLSSEATHCLFSNLG